jgi:4-hydroxyphenylpyruvate dioxygenase
MLSSIATVSLSGTLEEKIDAVADAGFDGLEIFENDLVTSPLSPAEIRRRCEDRLLYVDMYQPFRDFEAVSPEQLRRNLRRAEAKLELARELGARTMLLCANVATATVDDDDVMVEQLRQLGDLAASYGVRVAYEALAWSTFVPTYEHAWKIVEAVDHPFIGMCLDSFHIFSARSTIDTIASIPGDKIFSCQLADAPAMSLDPLSWSRHFRVFPGEGSFALPAFVAAVARTGYSGPLSLEIFNDVFRQSEARRTATDAMRSLRWVQDEAAALLPDASEPVARQLVRLTGLQPLEGLDFVELRTGGDGELVDVLDALGFDHRGRHRTKPVDLWAQGPVRLVVDETAGASGPTVAAIGFQVADSDASARRADQLLARPVDRESRADEVVLRAVAAPDSAEVYFNDARDGGDPSWLREFGEASDPLSRAGGAVGITGVDHVSLAHPWQHFDEAVLFYRSVVGLQPSTSMDVADPGGLVRSQVMTSPDGNLRLVLNVLPAGWAPGTHSHAEHIAFASDDLRATAAALAARGAEVLQIPPNYYADLGARFGLEREELDELQALNLLYDADETGWFLQLYTRTVGDTFFEIVQRGDGYSGFGGANAPVRRAAQRQADGAGGSRGATGRTTGSGSPS